jgi:outer membrane protein assembly factor BamB
VKNTFDQYSIVRFDPVTLQQTGKWPAPSTNSVDPDFASSPILFTATIGGKSVPMVGGCQKTGWFYALRTDTMQLVWQYQVGSSEAGGQIACNSGGVWDGSRLFVGGNRTTIGGTEYPGSVRRLDPATGAAIWQTPLAADPLGAGTINAKGLVAFAGTDWDSYVGNWLYLLDPSSGALIRALPDNGQAEFAQPIWADSRLYQTNVSEIVSWGV